MAATPLATLRFATGLGWALARTPRLMPTAIREARRLVPRRWWASAPYLPVPRRDYVEFRQVTLTGDAGGLPEVHDVMVWLDWCRSMRTLPSRA